MNKIIAALLIGILNFANADDTNNFPYGLWKLGKGTYYPSRAIIVDKDQRRLNIWEDQESGITKISSYTSDQGKKQGPKQSSGDLKTPEGIYFFNNMLEGKSLEFSLYGQRAFTTDYPNFFDRKEGKTGYGIWLHAIPDTESLDRGSKGCVVVRNSSIMEISKSIKLNQTPFLIFDKVKYISKDEFQEKSNEIQKALKDWHQAWSTKDINAYINFYSDTFTNQKMNKSAWKEYKENLTKVYKIIQIDLSDPVIFEVQSNIIVRMLQHYRSDYHEDFGEKILYLHRENDSFKILAEEWKALSKDVVLGELSQSQSFKSEKFSQAY